jgi:small neutral amino acid transporter SnatA (MarC family)
MPVPLRIVFGIDVEDLPAFLIINPDLPAGNACGVMVREAITAQATKAILAFMGTYFLEHWESSVNQCETGNCVDK